MDFKARFPLFSAYPTNLLETGRFVFPFDSPAVYLLKEIDAPDRSVIFLRFGNRFSADESKAFGYLTEAPPNCPMRRAFEFGEITWQDYWYSREWLIQLEMPFPDLGSMVPAKYIHPSEMDYRSKEYIDLYNHESPLMRHHEFLNNDRLYAKARKEPQYAKLEKEYQAFMLQYGRYLQKKAA